MCVCVEKKHKIKKNKANKNQKRNQLFLSDMGELCCTNIFVVCVLERFGWEVNYFLSTFKGSWPRVCVGCVRAFVQLHRILLLKRACGICIPCNSLGKTSPTHSFTLSASGKGFTPPSPLPLTRSKTHNYDFMSWFLLSRQCPPKTPTVL